MAWSIELSKFDVSYERRGAIKTQVLIDFVMKLITLPYEEREKEGNWIL